MTQFTDLPNEIVAMIAEQVFPRDVVNFSTTSKKIQSLSKPSLRKYHELRRRYRYCDCEGSRSPMSNLLHDIVLQPRAALYVEGLKIGTWFGCWHDGPESVHARYPEGKMVRLKEAVANFVPSDQVSTWVTAIESGDEDPLLALLLMLLPNVAALEIMAIGATCQKSFQTLTHLLGAPGVPLLANLTNLTIGWEVPEIDDCHHDWQAINTFARLPSLQSIIAWYVYIDDEDDDSGYLLQPRSSNVSSLTFCYCSIGAQRLYEHLKGFRALKRFSYKNADFIGNLFDTFGLRDALLSHAKASLECFNLTPLNAGENQYLGSLRDFENLTEVQTGLTDLVDAEHSGRSALSQLLPASVVTVHLYLYGLRYANLPTIENLILTAAKDKPELLPNLRQLHIRLYVGGMSAEDKELIGGMKEACENAGFELIVG